MNIETAFLLGVLVGQWLMLWALWRVSVRLLRVIAAIEAQKDMTPPPGNEIIYIPPEDISDAG